MDTFVLADDARIYPRAAFASAAQLRLPGEPEDYVLLRETSRVSSTIVSSPVKDFLDEFSQPVTIVGALVSYCRRTGALGEADEVLHDIYPVLLDLIRAGHLRRASSAHFAPPAERNRATFGRWKLLETLQALEDTAVHVASDEGGPSVILKVAGPSTEGRLLLDQEERMLRALSEGLGPRLMDSGDDPSPHLVLEHLPGITAEALAVELRTLDDGDGLQRLVVAVIEAYARLHAAGCLHGDVHPNNVLVDASMRVRLIDFALGRRLGASDDAPTFGGVGFFLAPEVAAVLQADGPWPTPTPASEQYGVAALSFRLLLGRDYVDFAFERNEMLRQIRDEPPTLPHEAHTALSGVLAHALAKRPDDRFASMTEFLAAARACLEHDAPPRSGTSATHDRWTGARGFVDGIAFDLRRRAHMDDAALLAPTGSLAYGAAGIAYTLLRLAERRRDGDLLAMADLWVTRHASLDDAAFTSKDLDVVPTTTGPISLLHSSAGVCFVRAMLAAVRNDPTTCSAAVRQFVTASSASHEPIELALGRAGALLGTARLVESLVHVSGVDLDLLVAFGNSLRREIADSLTHSLPPARCLNNGVAHGLPGVLHALLKWSEVLGEEVPAELLVHLDAYHGRGESHGRGLRWPIAVDGARRFMPSWCNGSAGTAMVFAYAAERTGQSRYADAAARAAWNCADEPTANAGLCCGVAGQAYAFLAAARVTGDAHWLQRAERAARAATTGGSLDWRPDSLWNGKPGVALLVDDLEEPDFARFPLFE